MIDDATLNDIQYTGFPEFIITDEIMIDIEREISTYTKKYRY